MEPIYINFHCTQPKHFQSISIFILIFFFQKTFLKYIYAFKFQKWDFLIPVLDMASSLCIDTFPFQGIVYEIFIDLTTVRGELKINQFSYNVTPEHIL